MKILIVIIHLKDDSTLTLGQERANKLNSHLQKQMKRQHQQLSHAWRRALKTTNNNNNGGIATFQLANKSSSFLFSNASGKSLIHRASGRNYHLNSTCLHQCSVVGAIDQEGIQTTRTVEEEEQLTKTWKERRQLKRMNRLKQKEEFKHSDEQIRERNEMVKEAMEKLKLRMNEMEDFQTVRKFLPKSISDAEDRKSVV